MFSFCDKSVEIPNMVFHQLTDLGWVAFDLCSSAVCLILLRQMRFWQKWLSNRAR